MTRNKKGQFAKKKISAWAQASPVSKAISIFTLIGVIGTASGVITGELQKWLVAPLVDRISNQRFLDSSVCNQRYKDFLDSCKDLRNKVVE